MSQHSTTRRIAAFASASAVLVALAGCSTPESDDPEPSGSDSASEAPVEVGDSTGVSDDTVKIGTHTPLTGPAAAGYSSISAAATAYFEYLNESGGVHGRSIDYIVKDDGYNPATTQTVVRELVQQDEVFAIVNGLGTPTHSSVLDYLNENEVPDLFVASGAVAWNRPDTYPFTFGFNADYVVEGAALTQYAVDEYPDAAICLLGQDDDFGDAMIQGAELVLGPDGLTHVERYSTSNQDVTAQIGAMQAAGCEINLLATINGFTALALGTSAQFNWFPMWFSSSSGADYPTLVTYLGEDVAPQLMQGFVGTNYLPSLGDDANEWVTLFRQINDDYNDGAPFDGNTIYGMSVAYLFAEALAAAGEDPTRESLMEVLTSGEIVGNGIVPLAFSDTVHAAYLAVGITQVDQGVQDYVGSAYSVVDGVVSATDLAPVALENDGIPASS
mgnify:CR=1 FL=1